MTNTTQIRYHFASATEEFPLSGEELARPLLLHDAGTPPLCLRDYFAAVQDFLLAADGRHLREALRAGCGLDVPAHALRVLTLASVKMGAFYHVARVEADTVDRGRARFAVSTAATAAGRQCLERDCANLAEILRLFPAAALPAPLALGTGGAPAFLHLASPWLEDFHEWHLGTGPANSPRPLVLWDWGKGFRPLAPAEGNAIIQEAARILAVTFAPETGRHIRGWHHAAGDFIARVDAAGVAVRLTTVREYAPFPDLPEYHPVLALVLHLLEASVLLRLDKVDGVGDTVWLDTPAVPATVTGFFQGLAGRSLPFGSAGEALGFIRAFSPAELEPLLQLALARLRVEAPADYAVAAPRAGEHLRALHQALQDFHL